MTLPEQIDAMRALGTEPVRRLSRPMIATVLMLPVLSVVCGRRGLIGGWVIARYNSLSQTNTGEPSMLWSFPMFSGPCSSVGFRYIISMTGCYVGLGTSGGTEGLGKIHDQKAVVLSSIYVHNGPTSFSTTSSSICHP